VAVKGIQHDQVPRGCGTNDGPSASTGGSALIPGYSTTKRQATCPSGQKATVSRRSASTRKRVGSGWGTRPARRARRHPPIRGTRCAGRWPARPAGCTPTARTPAPPWAVQPDHDPAAVRQRPALGMRDLPGHRPIRQRKGGQCVTGHIHPVSSMAMAAVLPASATQRTGQTESTSSAPGSNSRSSASCMPASLAPALTALPTKLRGSVTASLGSIVAMLAVRVTQVSGFGR
jgi:hypothetical protein